MVSICSRRWLISTLLLASYGCGRENVELYPGHVTSPGMPTDGGVNTPPVSAPPTTEQCAAKVPSGLLTPVPVLGWNGWNSFACSKTLDAQKVKDIASALISNGMQAAGYRYVNLDDCWELARGALGAIVLDSSKLPSGMLDLTQTLHAQGFQAGAYRRTAQCSGVPTSRQTDDAATYLSWQIDLLKIVRCQATDPVQQDAEFMAAAFRDAGRPVALSLVAPPFAEWMPDAAQLVRNSDPIQATWASILSVLDATTPLAAYARPGVFNDPDILEVGTALLSPGEARAHFSLWSILSAPLLAGNDVTTMTADIRDILTNREVIALDQDPLGLQGALIRSDGALQIYAKPLEGCGARGVVLFNRGELPVATTLEWSEIWLDSGSASVRDLWAGSDLGSAADQLTIDVPAHDVVALKVVGIEPPNLHDEVLVGDAPWSYATNGFGPVERNTSNGELAAGDGSPMRIAGRTFQGGLGVHAPSLVRFRLGGVCSRFTAQVGIDEEKDGGGSANFQVWADGEKLFDSGVMTASSAPLPVDVSVLGRNDLRLFVGTAGDGNAHDHADWADAHLSCKPITVAKDRAGALGSPHLSPQVGIPPAW